MGMLTEAIQGIAGNRTLLSLFLLHTFDRYDDRHYMVQQHCRDIVEGTELCVCHHEATTIQRARPKPEDPSKTTSLNHLI